MWPQIPPQRSPSTSPDLTAVTVPLLVQEVKLQLLQAVHPAMPPTKRIPLQVPENAQSEKELVLFILPTKPPQP